MVIDPNNNVSTNANTARRLNSSQSQASNDKGQVKDDANTNQAGSEVVLSEKAQTLTRLESTINTIPEVDVNRVEQIKQAIAEGRFEINADKIAENLLRQDELLG